MKTADGYEDLIPLVELYERLLPKAPELELLARKSTTFTQSNRLGGKAEGIRLALSFITEAMGERGLTYVAQARTWVDWNQMSDKGILDGD